MTHNCKHEPNSIAQERQQAKITAAIFNNIQTLDDGTPEGTFIFDNPIVFNSMLTAMDNKEDILT